MKAKEDMGILRTKVTDGTIVQVIPYFNSLFIYVPT
jgi:hypothetical protein